jgi:hemoglobin
VNPAPADVVDREDISQLVAEIYRRMVTGKLLGPVFVDVARVDLAVDPPVMCDLWQTVLLHAGLYRRNALRPHVDLTARIEVSPAYFTRWLSPWTAVVDERHIGETAELAKVQVACIASAISRGLYGRSLGEVPTIEISPSDQRLP